MRCNHPNPPWMGFVADKGHWIHLFHSLLQRHPLRAMSISWVVSRCLAGVMSLLRDALSGSICPRVSRVLEDAGS